MSAIRNGFPPGYGHGRAWPGPGGFTSPRMDTMKRHRKGRLCVKVGPLAGPRHRKVRQSGGNLFDAAHVSLYMYL